VITCPSNLTVGNGLSIPLKTMNKQLLQDLMDSIEARKQTEQRLKATVRTSLSLLEATRTVERSNVFGSRTQGKNYIRSCSCARKCFSVDKVRLSGLRLCRSEGPSRTATSGRSTLYTIGTDILLIRFIMFIYASCLVGNIMCRWVSCSHDRRTRFLSWRLF
jgi:hypothetical protein